MQELRIICFELNSANSVHRRVGICAAHSDSPAEDLANVKPAHDLSRDKVFTRVQFGFDRKLKPDRSRILDA